MKLTFFGGASSIGASCALVEIDDRRWVVDCGVRMRGTGSDQLPDFSPLEAGGAPSAIFITHAHLDHVGALPVLHTRYPLASIYATAPTIALTRIQLLDSLRIMEAEARAEGEIPLYSPRAVESVLEKMIPVTPLRAFTPDAGGPEVTFFPAGHILGACSAGIASREGNVFISGDISVDNQRTIPGMRAPAFRADAAVFESTYGRRLHPSRSAEEDRLVETVAAAVAAGGKVLVPAFAIGRAQEVILLLLRAQLLKRIPEFPVYVDGMVRATCNAYASFPWFLQSTLRKRIEKHGDPFYGVLDTVQPVHSGEHRKEILEGPPCAIVSSSGMLSGGPSPLYAKALLDGPENLIAITGYQDEESPGRRLLDVAGGRTETLALEGTEVRPRARIRTYTLSGHASGVQIAALVRSLRPRDVFLVHGDASARHELADLLVKERAGRIHLPQEGDPVEPPPRRARGGGQSAARRLKVTGIAAERQGAPPSPEDLAELAEHLRRTYREGMCFSVDELFRIWNGSAPKTPEEAEQFEAAIHSSPHLVPHPVRLFQFHAADPEAAAQEAPAFEEVGSLGRRIDEALPEDAELIRKSYQPGIPHMVLVFAFPDIAGARCTALLDGVFRESGWTYELHPIPNPAALDRVIRDALPDPGLVAGNVSTRMETREVSVSLSRALHAEEEPEWEASRALVRERTGFQLELRVQAHRAPPPARNPRDQHGRLEVNLAYAAIRSAFAGERHAPYRIGAKPAAPGGEPRIELTFVSPQIGERYGVKIAELAREIGWEIHIAPVADQNTMLKIARALLKDHKITKGPSFLPASREVSARLAAPLDPTERERIASEFEEATGYKLSLKA